MIFYLISFSIITILITIILKLTVENYLEKNSDAISIELFPENCIYKNNINENNTFIPADNSDIVATKLAIRNRGSVRIFEGNYFSPQEYSEFKKEILSKELP